MKIKYLPWQPHCFAFGGFEVQMLSTLKAVQDCGVDADKLDIWSRDANFDILHIWGLDHIHEIAIYFAKKSNKKVVITALFRDFDTRDTRFRHTLSKYIGMTKYVIKLAAQADSIVVVNDIEAEVASKYFAISPDKITYIPNIVDARYFDIDNKPGTFQNLKDYVLCTGNICKRKNQLNLVKACIEANLNLVLLGNELIGENEYCRQVRELINSSNNMLWLEGIKENSKELLLAYENCAVFALPSLFEQGPISAYEALASGCKVLLADRKYAYQEFFKQHVTHVNPLSVADICNALKKISSNLQRSTVSKLSVDKCRAENVGKSYSDLYRKLYNN